MSWDSQYKMAGEVVGWLINNHESLVRDQYTTHDVAREINNRYSNDMTPANVVEMVEALGWTDWPIRQCSPLHLTQTEQIKLIKIVQQLSPESKILIRKLKTLDVQ